MSPGIAYINASYDGIDATDGIVGEFLRFIRCTCCNKYHH